MSERLNATTLLMTRYFEIRIWCLCCILLPGIGCWGRRHPYKYISPHRSTWIRTRFALWLSPFPWPPVSLPNARPHLNLHLEEFWEPHIHFLLFEAWFTIALSQLWGAMNVYHMSLSVAHGQSYQLYQMTYVEQQKFDEEEEDVTYNITYIYKDFMTVLFSI